MSQWIEGTNDTKNYLVWLIKWNEMLYTDLLEFYDSSVDGRICYFCSLWAQLYIYTVKKNMCLMFL